MKTLTSALAIALFLGTSFASIDAEAQPRDQYYDRNDIRWSDRDNSRLDDDIVDIADLFTDRDLDKEFLNEQNYDRDGHYVGHPVFGDGDDFCPPGQAKKGRC